MGLFGRKKVARDRLGNIMGDYEMSVRLWAENRDDMYRWQAIGAGTLRLFQIVREMMPFKGIAGSHDSARLLMELGIQPMITVWNYERGTEGSKSNEGRHALLSSAQHLIDDKMWILSPDAVDLYRHFDDELQRFLYEGGDRGEIYASMFYLRYRECLAEQPVVKWDQLSFPLGSITNLLDACEPDPAVASLGEYAINQFMAGLDAAGKHMLATLDNLNNEWEEWPD